MHNNVRHSEQKVLGVFTLAMINVAAVASLKNFPVMAEVGLALVFFYFIAAVVFFIPTALVSAELATGWPSTGGIYTWVKQGFGGRWGFVAIWLQWIENVIWYPAMLAFVAATISYLFAPELAGNKYFILITILVVYWTCTVINFLGMEASGFISSVGAIIGTIIPSIIIIMLAIMWIMSGKPIQITFNLHALIPDTSHIDNFVFLVGVLLALCGMEMSAVHANEVENPQRDYPRAIFLATVIILTFCMFGSLAIAIVVPRAEISLVAGIMQAFSAFFEAEHITWLTPIVAIMIAIGAIAMVSTWIVGPSKGLLQTARDGDIPPFFQRVNKNNMPITIMLVQGLFVTVLAFAFLLMPTVSSSYWILTVLTAQLYLLMYILMFITGIRLRYTQKHIKREYSVPGGKYLGMWIVASCGILAALSGFVLGFFPPSQLATGNIWFYEGFLGFGVIVMLILPLFVYSQRHKGWQLKRN